jgi:hypothetical protein
MTPKSNYLIQIWECNLLIWLLAIITKFLPKFVKIHSHYFFLANSRSLSSEWKLLWHNVLFETCRFWRFKSKCNFISIWNENFNNYFVEELCSDKKHCTDCRENSVYISQSRVELHRTPLLCGAIHWKFILLHFLSKLLFICYLGNTANLIEARFWRRSLTTILRSLLFI